MAKIGSARARMKKAGEVAAGDPGMEAAPVRESEGQNVCAGCRHVAR